MFLVYHLEIISVNMAEVAVQSCCFCRHQSQRRKVTGRCRLGKKKHSVLFMMMSYTGGGCVVSFNNSIELCSQERPSYTVCTVILQLYARNQQC